MARFALPRNNGASHEADWLNRRTAARHPEGGRPLHPQDRSSYFEKVAEMLNGHEIGDGLVGRVAREAQRQFLRAPEFEPKRVQSRWDRDVPRFDKVSRRAF
jgi:hypothetical protein